ncbi:SH2B adapter protein 1 isoform X2 [Bactrocera dorsalis]|uniref:SH2B adapter protein 1 isoform X2 n=2 Tax=Bactrocera dorsalis TaxID=27457 RepID=A0A6I9VAH8_BACDO|nr:SH2B adapter protein 1 isoform X2 [Bactrocera dorsalis]
MGGNSTTNTFTAGGYIGPASGSSVGGSSGGAVGGDLIPNMSSASGTSYAYGTSWEEFCERHSRVAAADFAKACINYINGNLPPEEARNISYRSFGQKFAEAFVDHFETEFCHRRNNLKTGNGNSLEESGNTAEDSPKIFQKAFFRRLSFKGLRKGKTLFHKNSDDLDGSKHSKTKISKIIVECRKEGYVYNLTPESLDQPTGTQKWEKCRLALVKAVGGYMLEFYTPPKATKPRSGVFCFLISEARKTTRLEMPDRENTFVLKADNNMEYVIEAESSDEMHSWLATIRYCMRTPPTQQLPLESADALLTGGGGVGGIMGGISATTSMAMSPSGNLTSTDGTIPRSGGINNPQYHQTNILGSNGNVGPSSSQSDNALVSGNGGVGATATIGNDGNAIDGIPDIPPRRVGPGERGEQRLSASSNFEPEGDSELDINVADLTAEMRQYPWFHGTLPRSEAARMVLHSEAAGHGFFLVRQSETRKGEFVLTFNFQGRAKHLRMTLSEKGQCRVQHLWFPSIQEMLEHFRHNPIPLESGGTSDVTLTEWVHNQGTSCSGTIDASSNAETNGGHQPQQQQQQHPSPRHPQHVITMNMSVRLKTCEIELPFLHQQQQQTQPPHHHHVHVQPPQISAQQQQSHQQQQQPPPQQQQQQQQQLNTPQLRTSTVSLQSPNPHLSGARVASINDLNANEMGPRAVDNQYSFV